MNNKNNPIKIGKLEQFVADFDMDMQLTRHRMPLKTRGKVAVIGSGPAGLTVAGDLSKMGFNVTVYEAEKEPGGILLYGIPEFRLPKKVVKKEIKKIEELGVHFVNDTVIGPEITLKNLFEQGFDAIFIGTGTAVSKSLDIPGHTLRGIAQSHYFLRRVERYKEGELDRDEVYMNEGDTVLVIGSGNVAMDTARTAVRLIEIILKMNAALLMVSPFSENRSQKRSAKLLSTALSFSSLSGEITLFFFMSSIISA